MAEERKTQWSGLVIILACIAGAISSLNTYNESDETHGWSETTGVVLATRVEGVGDYGNYPVIQYRYEVYGVTYESDRVALTNPTSGQWVDANEYTLRYVEGQQVPVFFDPRTPSSAVLRKGSPGGQALSAIVFWVLGMFLGLAVYTGHIPIKLGSGK